MNLSLRALRRPAIAVVALAVAAFSLLPALSGRAYAYGQVTTRSITISSSIANDTGVSYLVSFTPASSSPIQGVAVDFCSNNPLIGSTCTLPTAFSVGTPTVTGVTITGQAGGGTWTPSSANSGRTLVLDDSTAQTGTPTQVTFTLTTAHNPSTLGSFYARIFTFGTSGQAATWAAASSGDGSSTTNVMDAGGLALSTVTAINITANVMETITFCTSGLVAAAPPTDCSAPTSPDINIGHNGGSGTNHLDNTAVDTASTYSVISTNAIHGAVVRMKTSNTCTNIATAGLRGGLSRSGGTSCDIEGVNSGNTAGVTMTAGTPSGDPGGGFGMCVLPTSASLGGSRATVPYNDPATNCGTLGATTQYGMDASSATAVTSTYGSQIFDTYDGTSVAPCSNVTDTLKFAATATLTTPAGIYSTTEQLIATGTF